MSEGDTQSEEHQNRSEVCEHITPMSDMEKYVFDRCGMHNYKDMPWCGALFDEDEKKAYDNCRARHLLEYAKMLEEKTKELATQIRGEGDARYIVTSKPARRSLLETKARSARAMLENKTKELATKFRSKGDAEEEVESVVKTGDASVEPSDGEGEEKLPAGSKTGGSKRRRPKRTKRRPSISRSKLSRSKLSRSKLSRSKLSKKKKSKKKRKKTRRRRR